MAATEFSGTYYCTLDAKNRLNVPADIRKKFAPEAENTLVFTMALGDSYLFAYPLNEWNRLTKLLRENDPFDSNVLEFVRLFVGNAHESRMDNQGRIMIPERILKLGNIENELAFVGSLEKLEVWNPKIYKEHINNLSMADLVRQINFKEMFYKNKTKEDSQVG